MMRFSVDIQAIQEVRITLSDGSDSYLARIGPLAGSTVNIWAEDQAHAAETIRALRAIADSLEANMPKLPAYGEEKAQKVRITMIEEVVTTVEG